MNFINIKQREGDLIFERLKMAEFLKVNDNNKIEVFVNIESSSQNEEEKRELEGRHKKKLNGFMTYAWPRLQFMDLDVEKYSKLFTEKIIIEKGWADEFKMAGIYVGWGVEPLKNEIEFKLKEGKIHLKWTCVVDDMDRYDQAFKPFRSEIYAELEFKEFGTMDEYRKYKKYKFDNRI